MTVRISPYIACVIVQNPRDTHRHAGLAPVRSLGILRSMARLRFVRLSLTRFTADAAVCNSSPFVVYLEQWCCISWLIAHDLQNPFLGTYLEPEMQHHTSRRQLISVYNKPAFSRFSQLFQPRFVVHSFGKIVKRQVCQKRGELPTAESYPPCFQKWHENVDEKIDDNKSNVWGEP